MASVISHSHFPLSGMWLSETRTRLGLLSKPPSPRCTPNTQNSREQRECHPALGPQRPKDKFLWDGVPRRPSPVSPHAKKSGTFAQEPAQRRGGGEAEPQKRLPRSRASLPGPPRGGSPAPAAARGHVRGGGAAPPAKGSRSPRQRGGRGDAALQLGADGHRHHLSEAARRRRPYPAEGARGGGGEGGPAGGVVGRSGSLTPPL